MLHTGECVCTTYITATSGNAMMYNTEGEKVWTKDLPHLASGATPYPIKLSTTPSGLIIMCDQNTYKVTVLDTSGKQLQEFPTEFIKKPLDICVDSQGVITLIVQCLSSVLTGHLLRSFSHTMLGSVELVFSGISICWVIILMMACICIKYNTTPGRR